MKILAIALLLASSLAFGQDYSRGYMFVAPVADTYSHKTQSDYAAGGGMERMLGDRFGVGFDLSGIVPGAGKAVKTVGTLSFDPYFHPWRNEKTDVFLTGGYSFFFRDFTANGWNVAAGVNYWYSENHGITFAIAEQAASKNPIFPEHHFLQFRVGWTFR